VRPAGIAPYPRPLAHSHNLEEATVDTIKDSAPAHPPTEESPHACLEGWVFITYEDEHGEEREASYPCRRCNDVVGETS
jgi:hypothetical protein